MPIIPISVASIMSDPNMSLSSSPFQARPGAVIKRASFPKGVVPKHLTGYLIKKGECAGRTGKAIYHGHPVPQTAVCVAEKHKK